MADHVNLHFSLLHTQTHVELSVRCSSQPMLRKDSHSKSHDFLLPFSEKLKVLSCPHACPLHIAGHCLLCTQQFSQQLLLLLSWVVWPYSHPGRSFTFLRLWVSLDFVLTSVQKHIFPEGANSAKRQCKVGGRSGEISTSNKCHSDQEWRYGEGWTLPGTASLSSPFVFTSSIAVSCEFGENFFCCVNVGAGGCSWTTADLQVLVPCMSGKSSLAPRRPRRFPFPEEQGRGRAGAQPAWMEWGHGSVCTWAGQSEDLWVMGFLTLSEENRNQTLRWLNVLNLILGFFHCFLGWVMEGEMVFSCSGHFSKCHSAMRTIQFLFVQK